MSGSDERNDSSGATGQGGTGAESIQFTEDAIRFAPGEKREITVSVTPMGEYAVRFTLLGDPRDAFFDQSELWSDAEGVAKATLTAPSEPATFVIRASVGGSVSAELPASAADSVTTLLVMPIYSGSRNVTSWVASVTTGHVCADLLGIPPPDGSLWAEAPVDYLPSVDYVPIGTPIAVTVRAGHFAGGCQDMIALVPDPIVTIDVVDRPLSVDETDMPLVLAVDAASEWRGALDLLTDKVVGAFMGDSLTDVHALLDAMQGETPNLTSSTGFSVARVADGWDTLVKSALGYTHAVEGLRTLIRRWIALGLEDLPQQPFVDGHLTADAITGLANFELYAVAGSSPTEMGFASSAPATLTADPDDTLRMGTNLDWTPSLLLTGVAQDPAIAEITGASDVPQALAMAYSCEDVGIALTSTNTFAFGTCDVACVTNLCERALRTMWSQAARASSEMSKMEIAAAGPADPIDDEAHPLGFSGPWVGTAALPDGSEVRFDGSATGGAVMAITIPQ